MFASQPAALGEALAIVYRVIAAFLIKKAGQRQAEAQCGAITLVQRFGSALNLNVHFHILIPDGVFLTTDPPYFRTLAAPTAPELQAPVQRISERVGRQLERKGWLVRDQESTYLDSNLALDADEEEASLKDMHGGTE